MRYVVICPDCERVLHSVFSGSATKRCPLCGKIYYYPEQRYEDFTGPVPDGVFSWSRWLVLREMIKAKNEAAALDLKRRLAAASAADAARVEAETQSKYPRRLNQF